MKKFNKNSPALRENSPSLQYVFDGQTAPSPAHCERSAQIICIGGVAFWVAKQQKWCTQCRTLRSCSAQLMICGRLANMRMWSCPHSCRTTLQRVFFLKDMASLVAFALLRWDLVWPTCTDCVNSTSHQSVLVAYNFGLATSCNPNFDATVHFNSSNILSVWDSFVVV
jgi:hypothetical protein